MHILLLLLLLYHYYYLMAPNWVNKYKHCYHHTHKPIPYHQVNFLPLWSNCWELPKHLQLTCKQLHWVTHLLITTKTFSCCLTGLPFKVTPAWAGCPPKMIFWNNWRTYFDRRKQWRRKITHIITVNSWQSIKSTERQLWWDLCWMTTWPYYLLGDLPTNTSQVIMDRYNRIQVDDMRTRL